MCMHEYICFSLVIYKIPNYISYVFGCHAEGFSMRNIGLGSLNSLDLLPVKKKLGFFFFLLKSEINMYA